MTAHTPTPHAVVTTADGGRLLRLALRLDATASGALGVVALAGPLTDLLGPPAGVLWGVGAFLVGYALALLVIAAQRPVPRAAAWTVVLGNLAWVGASVAAVPAGRTWLTALGVAVVLAQALAVAAFAALQWLGLRRM